MTEAAVIGGGPSGLMAAEIFGSAGVRVTVYDRMPTFGRKFLMAGRGGLNLTHSEPLPVFLTRYGAAQEWLTPAIEAFPPAALVDWAHGLGQETFVGSSGRVFPRTMKASPLLRAWSRRLVSLGVRFLPSHAWHGWTSDGALRLGTGEIRPDVTILALGGASWPRLGSDGSWTSFLPEAVVPWQPSNCGFAVDWSEHFRTRFAGHPLKRIAISFGGATHRGEAMISAAGIEGGAIYALSGPIRDAIAASGPITVTIDLRPDIPLAALAPRLNRARGSLSLTNFLRKQAGLPPEAIGLVQEVLRAGTNGTDLAALVKALPLVLRAPAPLARAISSAGGVRRDAVDANFMLRDRPGVFAAGEMLDWEAPTGGYLLQACFSTGAAAARGALGWLGR